MSFRSVALILGSHRMRKDSDLKWAELKKSLQKSDKDDVEILIEDVEDFFE